MTGHSTQLCLSAVLVLACLPLISVGQDLSSQTCDRDSSAVIQKNATAWIGGVISLNDVGVSGFGCGIPSGSMQAYEAMRWVLDVLNKKEEMLNGQYLTDYYVPGIRLGMKVTNYCLDDQSAIAALGDAFPELFGDHKSCRQTDKMVLGVIGTSTSESTIQVLEQSQKYNIPLISYEATAPLLTMSGKHDNFLRTISPDGPLVDVIVEVLQQLHWDYVAVVYDDDAYGRASYSLLRSRLVSKGICLTAGVVVDAGDLDNAVDALNQVMNTEAVGVIYFGPENFAKELIAKGNERLPDAGRLQWLLSDFPIDSTFPAGSVYQRGVVSVSSASRFIVEFEDHWMRIDEKMHSSGASENPWFTEWYEDRNNCRFEPTSREADCDDLYSGMSPTEIKLQKRALFQQHQYVEAAVMSVFTYARALRNAQRVKCGIVSGACQALVTMTRQDFFDNYLKQVDFRFTTDDRVPSLASKNVAPYNSFKHLRFNTNGDISDVSFNIWNFNNRNPGAGPDNFSFNRVGTYINGFLNLNNVAMYSMDRTTSLQPLPASPCPTVGCTPCVGLPADVKYYYEPGDVVINGIFSLHKMGPTPVSCGGHMSPNQFQYLQAMIYAIDKVNRDRTILPTIKLGGLGMDDCSSSTLSQAFLEQVQRGNVVISNSQGNDQLDPSTVEVYTAAHNSHLTLPLAEAMNSLMKPMVGYRAVSSELDDRTRYPYYIRALPGIYDEMKAIVLLLKKWNWYYVQVVSSEMPYSMNGEMVFRELAAKAGICIVATHTMRTTATNHADIVRGLQVNVNTFPVISLLEEMGNRHLLMALNDNPSVRSNLALIGTTRWGTSDYVVKGYEGIADGVLTLGLRHSSLKQFHSHLEGLNISTYTANPWFMEWYMAVHNCTMGAATGGLHRCDTHLPITAGNFQLMFEVESVLNAVRAIAKGLDATLKALCGTGYTTVCRGFLNANNKGMLFLEEIQKVTFAIEDLPPPNTFKFSGVSADIPFELFNYKQGVYQMVSVIDPWTSTISDSSAISLYRGTPLSRSTPTCPSPCLECLYMFNYMDYWYIPGDLVIGAVFDVHYAGDGPFSCGSLRTKNGALYTEVFNFALQKINSGNASVTLNNFALGGLAFDGCSNPPRATAIVNRVYTGMNIISGPGMPFLTKNLVSWMTYDSQTTIKVAEFLQAINMPLVSPGAHSTALNDKEKFHTFFRTIPSDSVVVNGMVNFIQEMGWKFVVVVNSPDHANREARDSFRDLLKGLGICLIASYEFETDGGHDIILSGIQQTGTQVVAVFSESDMYVEDFINVNADRNFDRDIKYISNRPWGHFTDRYTGMVQNVDRDLVNSVFFDLSFPTVAEFTTYLNQRGALTSDSNPWFRDVYEEVMNCNMPGSFNLKRLTCGMTDSITSERDWEQDVWTLSTLNAVYAVADAVNALKVERCGAGSAGICQAFYENDPMTAIMQKLDSAHFTDIASLFFNFINREANRGLRLFRYTDGSTPVVEGFLSSNGSLTLKNRDSLFQKYHDVKSQCQGDCLMCSASDANLQDFSLIEGDIYIVGLFDVHKKGNTPFTCGGINHKHGLQLLEAFNYAVEYINNKTGMFVNMLQGVRLGAVGLDMCQSPSRAANLVANIHSGDVKLTRGIFDVNPKRIDAYIATMDTESSVRVADILTQLAMPQISYGATGLDILDREKYNFFLRTVPADDKQARAIVSYLKKFKYNNIQVIYSFDEIGEPGLKMFEDVALANTICVNKIMIVGEKGHISEAEASMVVAKLAVRNGPPAQVIVLWMKDPMPILIAASDNETISKTFLFIVTDKWGADPNYLKDPRLTTLLRNRNLVTLDVETADIPGFDRYLEYKTPANYVADPWFKEYFEALQGCYWDTPTGTLTKACDKSSTIPRAREYVQDPYVLYVVNAVFSAAIGIHYARNALCIRDGQTSYSGVCNQYRTSGERRQNVMKGLLKVNFTDSTFQPFFYTEDGQSNRGFHIYNVTSQRSSSGFMYTNVGSYNDSDFLKLDITYDSHFKAVCNVAGDNSNSKACKCPFPPAKPSRYMKDDSGGRGLTLVYIGDIHQPDPSNTLGCGPINVGTDLQKLLAFFYAIDRVNSNADFSLPDSVKLNGLALDSCTHGLRLGQDVYNVLSGNQLCDTDLDQELISPSSIVSFIIDKDKNALPVSQILTDYKITSISPTAGSDLLNDRFLHPYFLRIRGDNSGLAHIILQVAQRADWNYLSVIYSASLKHQMAKNTLLDKSQAQSVCIGDTVSLDMDATLDDTKFVLEKISQQVGARGVVLFVEPAHLKLLLEATRDLGLTGRFAWVIPSEWAQNENDIGGMEQEVAGSIMIEARSAILKDFNDYVKSLTLTNRRGIPDDWFLEIYQTLHKCNVLNLNSNMRHYSQICSEVERITDNMISQDPAILNVIVSVYSAVLGLNGIRECQGTSLDIAACLQVRENQRNDLIYRGIASVNFPVLPQLLGDDSFEFSFDANGNGQAGYIVKNYRTTSADDRTDPNGILPPYAAFKIGNYIRSELTLDLTTYAGGDMLNRGVVPVSRCAPGVTCNCKMSDGRSWLFTPSPVLKVSDVKVGRTYADPETHEAVLVIGIPSTSDRFSDIWSIIVCVLAALGAFISAALFIYLLVMYPVRGGTSVLGFILSLGIVLLYLMVFPFVAHADDQVCGLRKFGLGFVYAVVYSALLVKLVDCWRVRGKGDSYNVKYSKLGRPTGLFMVTVLFVLVQVMIDAEWMILREPSMERIFYNSYYWPRCTPHDFYDESLVLSLVYVMVLIVFSLFLGCVTYTSTKNHRESRWILGILILTIPCWVIWCTVAIMAEYKVRDAAVAVGLLINATIMLLLVPIRKLFLLHKYNALNEKEEEEERQSRITASHRGGNYSSVYGHQYDNHPRLQDTGSNIGSGRGTY